MEHGQLLHGDNAQQMSRCGIGWINQTHLDWFAGSWSEIQISQGQALAGAHAHVHLLKGLILNNLQRSTKGRKPFLSRHNGMTQNQLMGACT